MKALTFQLHLLEPLLATRLGGGDPNSAAGFEFVPGSMIRGMIIARYTQQQSADAEDAAFRHLFLDGGTRFLNAYPRVSGRRALPTPLSWRKEKDKDEQLYDFAMKAHNGDRQWKKAEKPFCYLWHSEDGDIKAEMCRPERQVNIHIAREERTVFRYDALAPGQTFCGAILAEQESDLEILKEWLPEGETISLGGSHLAGYGAARLEQVQIQDNWEEYKTVGENTDRVAVTLLSDALIRDQQTGAYCGTLQPVVDIDYVHEQAFVGMRVVGGFNRKWNLPLPQTQAIQAGSVFVYPTKPALLERLQALEVTGIGERRAEGFGRIAVNWHRAGEITPVEKSRPSTPLPLTLHDGTGADLAQRMVERMLREKLDRALIVAANHLEIQRPYPRNAQLSRMRIVARRALSQNNPHIIIEHLDKMKKAAKDQFHRAKIGNDRLDEWLRARAEDPKEIWHLRVDTKRINIGGMGPQLTDSLALEYTARLIDRVLRKVQKEAANE